MNTQIFCGKLITPFEMLEDMLVSIDGGKISGIRHVSERYNCQCGYSHISDVPAEAFDAGESIVTPGFIDVHIHGGAGFDVMDATQESLEGISRHLAGSGVTSFLPTTVTAPWDDMVSVVSAVADAMEGGTSGAQVLGVHLEGPYLNPERKGAQYPDYLREPSIEEFREKLGSLSSVVRIVTLAPELPGATDLIRYLAVRNINVSMGHSEATFEEAADAIDAGANHATHLFNAMRPLQHRDPGITGAVLADDRVRAELVWDNLHVHPGTARVVVNAKGPENVMLVSDAMPAAGLPDGDYHLGAHKVFVRNGEARLLDGTIASSIITLDVAVRNAARFFPLQDAVMMATYVPAYGAGAEKYKGSIAVGKDADLAILSAQLEVTEVVLRGCILGQKT
jgi:N-acetylglucosamine-6-phosphate deacetylase